jgi:hypothetical protein
MDQVNQKQVDLMLKYLDGRNDTAMIRVREGLRRGIDGKFTKIHDEFYHRLGGRMNKATMQAAVAGINAMLDAYYGEDED